MTNSNDSTPTGLSRRSEDAGSIEGARESLLALYVSAAFGSAFLTLADLVSNVDAAMTVKIGEVLNRYFGADHLQLYQLVWLALILTTLAGLGLVYVYRPGTRVDAFTRGASVFAILTIIVPLQVPGTPEESDPVTGLQGAREVQLGVIALVSANHGAPRQNNPVQFWVRTEDDQPVLADGWATLRSIETRAIVGTRTSDERLVSDLTTVWPALSRH